nr:GNAT family N-acetyltransferase [Nitrosomonas nitrosa]
MNYLADRINLALSHGGLSATAFWLLKILCRIKVHFLYAIDLANRSATSKTSTHHPDFDFISLHTQHDIDSAPSALIAQLNEQSGLSVNRLIEQGSTVYALVDDSNIVSQLNIGWQPIITVDSPTHLTFTLSPKDAFLGYLFTYPKYRGCGAATKLVEKVCEDAAFRKYSRIVTHIRSTNAPSLNTFKKIGWKRIGWILTSTNGRLLSTRSAKKMGVHIAKANHPAIDG